MRSLKTIGLCALCLLGLAWVVQLHKPFAKAQYGSGLGDFSRQNYAEAARHFRNAALLGERSDYHQALCAYHLGEQKDAERILLRAGDSAEVKIALGVVYMAEYRDEAANRLFLSEVDRTKDQTYHGKALAWYNLSLLRRRRGDVKDANAAMREALKWSAGECAAWSGPQAYYPRPNAPQTPAKS